MYRIIDFPDKTEYPVYAGMYMKWVQKDGTLLRQLERQLYKTKKIVASIPEELLEYRYAPGKWSVKDVLVHMVDDERIYAFRALSFARNDQSNFPGFDENEYTQYADTHNRSIDNIMEEYESVRKATITLFNGFSDQALTRIGTANENRTSVRALGYHILGHELHHLSVIAEKYMSNFYKVSE